MDERWDKIESIFNKVLEAEESRRSAVLEKLCAGDEWLKREVESLLAQHSKARDFIESPAFEDVEPAPSLGARTAAMFSIEPRPTTSVRFGDNHAEVLFSLKGLVEYATETGTGPRWRPTGRRCSFTTPVRKTSIRLTWSSRKPRSTPNERPVHE